MMLPIRLIISILKVFTSKSIYSLSGTFKKICTSIVYCGFIYGLVACGGGNNDEKQTPTPITLDTIAPSTPSNLTASAPSATQVNLSWTASTDNVGVVKYQIFRVGNAAVLTETTTTSFSDTTVVGNTNYSYTVRAVDAANNVSPSSNAANIQTPVTADNTAPSTPSNLTASAPSATQVNLSWTASTDNVGVVKYQIFRVGNAAVLTETTTTSFSDTTVVGNTNYSYTVRAVDAANNVSSASNAANIQTPAASTTPIPVTIAPLGSPRILVSDTSTMNRLRNLISSGAPTAVRFKTMVDRQITGTNHYGFEPWYAALMGQITGIASYCTYAVNRTENFVASEETLIASNARPTVAGDSYLEVGSKIGNVALVYDWCRSSMSDAQRTRWINYANQAVWNVWNHTQARWGATLYPWTGWSVDNPVNNYYYSFLEATSYLGLATYGENTQAANWINQFRTVKLENQLSLSLIVT